MSHIAYGEIFKVATKQPSPYAYQCRLACGPEAKPDDESTLKQGTVCRSQLIEIPTGCGKTAAVVLAWLWNRVLQPDTGARKQWPRRLVFCLPMRTLVEQTRDNVREWLANHGGLEWSGAPISHDGKVGLHILMGGEEKADWDLYPEHDAILIGTQDMLLSRALNRGYGMSRYRWPMHFGLLNNDCLWVLDETQLMGVGVQTSAQLDGFRDGRALGATNIAPTWWMSATLDTAQLSTVDHAEPSGGGWPKIVLEDADLGMAAIRARFEAKKPIAKAPFALTSATKDSYAKQLSSLIAERHQRGSLTLVVVNRVRRAQKVYGELKKLKTGIDPERVALIHSRFRPVDRKKHEQFLNATGDRIIIATQAVEAGVDISARLLITELAPWSSLVQRFGRCNRDGQTPDAEVLWIDIQPKDEKDELLLPYDSESLNKARGAIETLTDVAPKSVAHIAVPAPFVIRPVIRKKDLIDLFDTTPDVCGQDIDISRYIRDGEDNDVQFFWRSFDETDIEANGKPLDRDELCRVSIGDAAKFLKNDKVRALVWDALNEVWNETKRVRPGGVYLLDAQSGGYMQDEGWTGDPKSKIGECRKGAPGREAYSRNRLTFIGEWQTITHHTANVLDELAAITASLSLAPELLAAERTAALWHDVGKAHQVFQQMLGGEESQLWAKSDHKGGKPKRDGIEVKGFRHELASALAWLVADGADGADGVDPDLVAYLIAAHHGRVRLSIRSLPDESPRPEDPNKLHARGVWDGDKLPEVALGELAVPALTLDLSFMKMGEGQHGPSWLARMVALRDRLGPLRLAYLETILRAADARASAQ